MQTHTRENPCKIIKVLKSILEQILLTTHLNTAIMIKTFQERVFLTKDPQIIHNHIVKEETIDDGINDGNNLDYPNN